MAAGAGYTAAADLSIANLTVGSSSGQYAAPGSGNMWWALYTTQFTASTKSGATEWSSASDTNYARQPMGNSGTRSTGWTIAAYSNGVGIVFNNFAQLTQPAVAGTGQTLFSMAFCDAVTSGNIDLFIDLVNSQAVSIGLQTILLATTGVVYTLY